MSDDSKLVNQSEIEELLRQAKAGQSPGPIASAAPPTAEAHQGQAHAESPSTGPKTSPAAASFPSTTRADEIPGDPMATDFASRLPQVPAAGGFAPRAAAANPGYGDPAAAGIAHGDIEYLFNQAQQALASVDAPRQPGPLTGIAPFRLEEFSGAAVSSEVATLELIRDVELDLKIELGRTQMYLEDVLKLRKGSVVPLDKLAGDPVDIYVNGRLIARGEVLVLNDNFCVRVAELIAAEPAKAG